jgi:hypothetical protein
MVGVRTRLFHAIVGLGLAACGGSVSELGNTNDGGADGSSDAAVGDAGDASADASSDADADGGFLVDSGPPDSGSTLDATWDAVPIR